MDKDKITWIIDRKCRALPEVLVAEQMEGVQYGTYYACGTFFFFASAGDSEIVDFSKLILAFDIDIWYILLAFILVLSISVTMFDISHEIFREKRPKNKFQALESNFWMFLASFFLEGTARMPSLQRSRFIFGIWLMSVVIIMNAYSSQLKSALMLKGDGDTMYTVKDLSKRPDLTVFIRKSGFLEKVFEESPTAEYRKVWKNIEDKGKDGLLNIEELFSQSPYEVIKAGKGVILNPIEVVKFLLQSYCPAMKGGRRFYFLNEPVLSNFYMYYTSPTFPENYIRELNKRVRWILEAHLMERWIDDTHKDYERSCSSGSERLHSENTETQGLGLEHIQPIVFITLIAQSFTVLVLFAEIISFRFKKQR